MVTMGRKQIYVALALLMIPFVLLFGGTQAQTAEEIAAAIDECDKQCTDPMFQVTCLVDCRTNAIGK